MLTRRHFLKMIGYTGAALAAVKVGGVAAAKSLMKGPEPELLKNWTSIGPGAKEIYNKVNFTVSNLKAEDRVLVCDADTGEQLINQIVGPNHTKVSAFIKEPREVVTTIRSSRYKAFYSGHINHDGRTQTEIAYARVLDRSY